MAKEVRGGKYVPVPKEDRVRRRSVKEEPIDVQLISFTENGKVYYTFQYVGTDKRLGVKWRQTYSPRKYARKHNFNII